jgi:hypothetical protein
MSVSYLEFLFGRCIEKSTKTTAAVTEKLTVAQLVTYAVYRTRRSITVFITASHWTLF